MELVANKKPYVKRLQRDSSQAIRLGTQAAFLLLNLWIGVQFLLFVRAYEQGLTPSVSRPPGVEGYLPIAGLMNWKYWLLTGDIPVMHPAAMFLIAAFLLISLLFRKAFCGWLCPVGTLSEYLWKAGRSLFRRNFQLPRWLDIGLRSLKYVLLGLFLYAVGSMGPIAIRAFLESPYGVVADVKMLNFFRYLSVTSAVAIALLMFASIFVRNFWCRYLCPYGALMGLASLLSPLRIRREPDKCIDCAKCATACPSGLKVDVLVQIRSAECLGCMECVAVCPAEGALQLSLPGKRRVAPWAVACGVAVVFFGFVGYARLSGHWDSPVSPELYRTLIPQAREFEHP